MSNDCPELGVGAAKDHQDLPSRVDVWPEKYRHLGVIHVEWRSVTPGVHDFDARYHSLHVLTRGYLDKAVDIATKGP